MILAALASNLFLTCQVSTEDTEKIVAVQSVVNLASRIEAACQPRFLTNPPTPVSLVPRLPVLPGWAKERRRGGYSVSYSDLGGIVEDGRVKVVFPQPPDRPKDSRLWSEEECLASGRTVAGVVTPTGFLLGESSVAVPSQFEPCIRTRIVLAQDPRVVVRLVDCWIDARTGLPREAETIPHPKIAPERLIGIRPIQDLTNEAIRIHRSQPSIGSAHLDQAELVYRVPRFSGARISEATDAHRGYELRQEAIPMYEWWLSHDDSSAVTLRKIWVDARTGRGIAVEDRVMPWTGAKNPERPSTCLDADLWRLGRATGSFVRVTDVAFEGVPTVVTNVKGEVLTLRFDRKTGLVRDETATYRPDAALLRAMRAERAPVPFGKR